MHYGLNALTRRTLGVAAIALALAANAASNYHLFFLSTGSEFNELLVNDADGAKELQSGDEQGWWSATHSNTPGNVSYFVGYFEDDINQKVGDLNNFFVFNISTLNAPVTSAVLHLQYFTAFSSIGAATILYSLFDVTTPITELNDNDGISEEIYKDLGGGKSYGSFSVSTGLAEDALLSLTLNSAALADLNAAIAGGVGKFAIGGTLKPEKEEVVVEQQNSVPDGANTLVLFGLAAAGIWSLRNRKRAA